MRNLLKLSSVFLLLVLMGCAPRIADIAANPPSSGNFEKALFDNYIELANLENAEYDRVDAGKFAARAATISAGNEVAPEEISMRNLPADRVGILTGARARLVRAFESGAIKSAPIELAKAQSSFDCWMQEQEENRQHKDIEACQNDFIAAMNKVDAASKITQAAPMATTSSIAAYMPSKMVVYFDFDKSSITSSIMKKINNIVAAYKNSGASSLNIGGHTDTSGSNNYNDKLSGLRVNNVRDALIAKSIPASAVSAVSFGKRMPAKITGDNVREAQNRRVEVRFLK